MGEVFAGRYELLVPIAEGGMGTVWQVLDREDGRLKAAKILRQSDASALLRFVREQSMRIDHAHVVTPQSWAGMDDRVLFTMPLVRGGSVHGLLRTHGALPLRWTAALLDQTLQALEAVHRAGIVHRDVKPANLLLEPTGRGRPHLRLTDFGIAVPLDQPRMTRASMAIGSPGYMAPEQWHGADPDFRQDVYAVGVVGLEMLTGVRPRADAGPVDLSVLDRLEERRRALGLLLGRAASGSPGDRPATAADLRAELAGLDLSDEAPDDIEVVDHFPAPSQPAPADAATRAATRVGTPRDTPPLATAVVDDQAATRIGAPVPDERDGSPGSSRADGAPARRSPVPGLVLVLLGLIALVAALALALTV